jgi:hypothetical protein
MAKTRRARKARKSIRKSVRKIKMWGGNPTRELIIKQRDSVISAKTLHDDYYNNNILYHHPTKEQSNKRYELLADYSAKLTRLHEMINEHVDSNYDYYVQNGEQHIKDIQEFMKGTN